MRVLLILALAATALTPAVAQRQVSPEERIQRLERQVRQLQRRIYPKGQPADTAGFVDDPAVTQASFGQLSSRLDSIERQMADLTRQSEESGNRVTVMEAELARMRADQDRRFRAIETGTPDAGGSTGPTPAAEPDTSSENAPVPSRPKFENSSAPKPLPAASTSGDAGEQAYDQGYQLWMGKRYNEAITSLRAMASSFPGHRRVSWANNLTGRALLDSGQPRAAAEALLANYRNDPRGERAADSLFYLGEALVALKQPGQACKAYDELREVYGASMRPALREMLAPARAKAGCK